MSDGLTSFEKFWPFYLGEHGRPATKRWHTAGTGVAMVCHYVMLPWSRSLWWVPIGFVVGYIFAWYSHYFVEGNRPATFKHPYWSFFADIEQFFLMILGWMPGELARLAEQGHLAPTALRGVFRIGVQVFVFAYLGGVSLLWYRGYLGFAALF
jgi:hypothetical protein